MTGALRAEWTKFRTVSSSVWLVVAVVVLTVGVGSAVAGTVDTGMCPTPTTCDEDLAKLVLSGVWGGQIAVAVLAVLVVTGEYGNRTMSPTLTCTPRRANVFVAKTGMVTIVTLLVAAVSVAASFVLGKMIVAGHGFSERNGYAELSLSDGPTFRAVVGTVLYLGLIALLGAGLGAVVRDTGATLTLLMALLFVVPLGAEFVSDPDWHERLQRLSPTTAGLAIQSTVGLDELPIAPWPGLGVLAAYAIAAAAAGSSALVVRDA